MEAVAKLVPRDGVVVEVGSYLGRSSWAWAKSVDPSVTVYCCDPWDGYRGSSRELFASHTSDCPNIVALQGYSPQDFRDWDRPIDLYFEDAVHRNPVLRENLDFWTGFLKPGGIVCGHDYLGKFPDVVKEAHALGERLGCRLLHVESFWCLLPESAFRVLEVVETMTALERDVITEFRHAIEPGRPSYFVNRGEPLTLSGSVRNATEQDWRIDAGVYSVKMGARVFSAATGEKRIEGRGVLPVEALPAGAGTDYEVTVDTSTLEPGEYRVRLDLVVDYVYWFESRGATAAEVSLTVLE